MKLSLLAVGLGLFVAACSPSPPRVEAREATAAGGAAFVDRELTLGVGWSAMFRAMDGDQPTRVHLESDNPEALTVGEAGAPGGVLEAESRFVFLPRRVGSVRVRAVVDREVVAVTTVTVVDPPSPPK